MDQIIHSAGIERTDKQDSLPSVLEQYLDADCDRQARRIAEFIKVHELLPDPQNISHLPLSFMLLLDVTVRFIWWERTGFIKTNNGGPSISEAVFQLANHSLIDPTYDAFPVWSSVFHLVVEQFAWHIPAKMDGDIALGIIHVDDVVTHLAKFLWSIRSR